MSTPCETCGLPAELCVCDDVAADQTTVTITVEERAYNDVTIIAGLDQDTTDLAALRSELQSNLGCGGTHYDDMIELQGDQTDRVEQLLDQHGISVE